jgi:hypothetical protein
VPETLHKRVRGAINVTFGKYNGFVYFFHEDGTYSRFNRMTCELEYYADTSENWPGWPKSWPCPQAAATWDSEWVYLLRGSDYTRYDLIKDTGDTVEPVDRNWPRWPSKWLDRVDAGLYWGYHFEEKRRKAYFFRDDKYLRYDLKNDRVDDGYPLTTRDFWPNWPARWKNVSAAIDWGNGKVYFFSETEYLRYDKFYERVDAGYPRPLGEFLTEHREKLEKESKTLVFEDRLPAGVRSSFVFAVRKLATELGIRPNWLIASMWMESKFQPRANNGGNVGLHQLSLENIYRIWGRAALPAMFPNLFQGQPFVHLAQEAKRALGKAFAELDFGQMPFVAAWLRGAFKEAKGTCRSFDQLKLIGFGGVGLARPDRTLLAPVVVANNKRFDLSGDRQLDVAEFRAAVFDILHEELRTDPTNDSEVRHALG